MEDVEYAETDAAGQLALGVPGDQRAIPGLGAPLASGESCAKCGASPDEPCRRPAGMACWRDQQRPSTPTIFHGQGALDD